MGPGGLFDHIYIFIGCVHVIMFAREALHAIRLGKIVQLVLIGGNVLAALLDLLLQTAYLPSATDLLDHALIADEQDEPAEQHQRNHVLVQHPAPNPRMLGYVLLYVLKNLHDAVIQNVSNSTRLNSLQRYKKNLTFANIFTKKYRLFHFTTDALTFVTYPLCRIYSAICERILIFRFDGNFIYVYC